MYRRVNLIALRHKRLVGDFLDDMYSPDRQRLEFYRWLYLQGRLNEGRPAPSRFEQLLAELRSRPVVPIDDLVAEARMRRMIPASDEQEDRFP